MSQKILKSGFSGRFLLALFLGTLTFCLTSEITTAQTDRDQEFRAPGKTFRLGRNIHSVPATPEEQAASIDNFIAGGYGRISTNVNWTDDYMENAAEFDKLYSFARLAREKGLDVWLYDENTYPSGMAGDIILSEHPEWEASGIFFLQTRVKPNTEVSLKNEKKNLLCVFAVPVIDDKPVLDKRIDLSDNVQDNTLNWKSPDGNWFVCMISTDVLYEGFQAGTVRGKARRYTSLLMPEVGQRFIEVTHKRYAQALGNKLGTVFSTTFTDEPSAMAQYYGLHEYGVYPWKENVSAEYQMRTGRELVDDLPAIMLDADSFGQQCRCHYFKIIADFMSLNYFKAIKDYDATQNLRSSGHLLLEESIMAHVPLYGDIMACYRQMDMPGIDILTGMPTLTRHYLYSSRLASSAAELNGGFDVMCENCPVSDHSVYNGQEAPTVQIRGVLNREFLGGVTETSDYLVLCHEDNPGKDVVNTYSARILSQLTGGKRAARIAVYYPIESTWTHFRPYPSGLAGWFDINGGDPDAQHISSVFKSVSDTLYDHQWEFSYLDAQGLIESRVEEKSLVHNQLAWDVVILPFVETLSEEAMNRLDEFVNSGGKLILIEKYPVNSMTEFPSTKYAALCDQWKQHPSVTFLKEFNADELHQALNSMLTREIEFSSSQGILCTQRQIDGYDVFFVINDTEGDLDVTATLSGSAIDLRIPRTGEIIPVELTDQKASIPLHFEPYEGIVIKRVR